MSVEVVKKRGRPKKALENVEQELIVLDEPVKPKPSKSVTKKKPLKESTEPAAIQENTKIAKKVPISREKKNESVNVSQQKASLPQPKVDAAKANAGSAILQQATAFAKVAPESATLTNSREAVLDAAVLQDPSTSSNEHIDLIASVQPVDTPAEVTQPPSTQPLSVATKQPEPRSPGKSDSTHKSTREQIFNAASTEHITASVPRRNLKSLPASAPVAVATPEVDSSPSATSLNMPHHAVTSSHDASPKPSTTQPQPATAVPTSTVPKPAPQFPTAFKPPPGPPPPPRPTQMPYSELKKNPEFKALSRKYTSLFIAIPIALFTSYVLYGRCKCAPCQP